MKLTKANLREIIKEELLSEVSTLHKYGLDLIEMIGIFEKQFKRDREFAKNSKIHKAIDEMRKQWYIMDKEMGMFK